MTYKTISYIKCINECQTGDIILLHSTNLLSSIIQHTTSSHFEHVAIILKDISSEYKGIYIMDISLFEFAKLIPIQQFFKLHSKTNTVFFYKKIKHNIQINNRLIVKAIRYLTSKTYNYNLIWCYLLNQKPPLNYKKFTCCNLIIFLHIYMNILPKSYFKKYFKIAPTFFSFYENKKSIPQFSIPEKRIIL